MESPMTFNVNFALQELPLCPCGNNLLPVQDIAREGSVPYLKGWMCLNCNKAYMFKSGSIYEQAIFPERSET